MQVESEHRVPVIYSTISADALVKIVEADYCLDSPLQCKFWHRGFNDSYLVTADKTKYILRVYSSGKYWIRSQSDFRFELDLLSHLYQRNVPVSYPIIRRDGDLLGTIRAPEGVRYFALFSFATGKPVIPFDPEHCQILGENVARLHLAANHFATKHTRYHLDLDILVDKPMQFIERYMGEERGDDIKFLAELSEQLKKHILALTFPADGYGIIHADINEANVHFGADHSVVFFDFDHCGYGWRAFDIAVSLTGEPSENQTAYLQGYQSVRELCQPELEAIPTFVRMRCIWDVGDNLARADAHGLGWCNDKYWNSLMTLVSGKKED
jgi:Ser/Thr protein kinase RdoA (MazF antagonist)